VTTYDNTTCWQYNIRVANLEEDLKLANLTKEQAENLTCQDFTFCEVTSKEEKKNLVEFIKRHEWLGTISQYPTHYFACYYKDILAGVLMFNVPNAFTKMLGEDTDKLERLISRGSCISWSPKNLASKFIMWAINYMVQNTRYRLFTAYSDVEAGELGTIYQACGFYCLGKGSGTTRRYINPYTGKVVSDRFFRHKTAYKKFAQELNIPWQKDWNHSTGMSWNNIPDNIEKQLRDFSKQKQASSTLIEKPSKYKYAYVLGRDRRETRALRKQFLSLNKIYDYPKERGK